MINIILYFLEINNEGFITFRYGSVSVSYLYNTSMNMNNLCFSYHINFISHMELRTRGKLWIIFHKSIIFSINNFISDMESRTRGKLWIKFHKSIIFNITNIDRSFFDLYIMKNPIWRKIDQSFCLATINW